MTVRQFKALPGLGTKEEVEVLYYRLLQHLATQKDQLLFDLLTRIKQSRI